MTSASLPCPFCGHSGLYFHEGSSYRWIVAECGKCGANRGEIRLQTSGIDKAQAWEEAKVRAIQEWNQRVERSSTEKERSVK